MAKLNDIDNAAASKGAGIKTLWQFIKIIFVSLIAFVIQAFLPPIIEKFMADEFLHQSYNILNIFTDSVDKKTGLVVGLGIFIAMNVSNVLAQIVSFFINRDKTFNSDANIAITLPIYIVFTIALICFSAWVGPKFVAIFTPLLKGNLELATTISSALCGMIQFFLYFPFDKLLFPEKKKEEAAEETKDAE